MEIPRYWRLKKSLRVFNGRAITDQRELQISMVKAGSSDRTAQEALDAYYSYVQRRQNEILQIGIDERTPIIVQALEELAV